ncbi:hypothetical protein FRC07_008667 [Ceratobasidium sp. 392]|nr:hypothetical protein FRC07_008667 [Ceratobasidium sp. 392]
MSRSDRIALASIKTLTLYDGRPTKARRTAPVPQLECTGSVCREYQPSAIQCTNAGGSDIDIDWKCEADLPSSLRFGRLSVSCEGWDRPGDPFVLRGEFQFISSTAP